MGLVLLETMKKTLLQSMQKLTAGLSSHPSHNLLSVGSTRLFCSLSEGMVAVPEGQRGQKHWFSVVCKNLLRI